MSKRLCNLQRLRTTRALPWRSLAIGRSLWTARLAASVLLVAWCWPVVAEDLEQGLLIAEGKRALLPIVVSPQASASTRSVADELAMYLEQITGATFEVSSGDGESGIVLGTLAEFPDSMLQRPLEIRDRFDGREAFAIRTDPGRLRLIGATDKAASHAAFALLEAIGCRWFFEAPEWEVVPSIPTLRVKVNRDERPAILSRRIWFGGGFFEHGAASRPVRDYAAWARHNRMEQSLTVNCGHAWQTIIADNKAVFDMHPEYRALVSGKRQGDQLCVSNAALRELVIRWALDFFRKNPTADMVSVDPSDGSGQCECQACARLGTISDRVFGLANDVAKAVGREHPGKLVGLYAYHEHSEPPSFSLEPNVYVQLTAGFTRGRYTFDELLELWPQKCKSMGFYEYFSVWPWDLDQFPGGRANDTAYLREQIPRYLAAGATSLDCESSGNWGLHGRGYYLAHKLMWDPTTDVEALLDDFYSKAFGPAAVPMRRYYERFDRAHQPLISAHLLAQGFRDVEEATRLAADRPDVQARLDHIKHYLRSVHLRWRVDRATDPALKKELTLAALTHGYRTRYSYMNHWVGMRDSWASQAAEEFGEPGWAAPGNPMPSAPWAVESPYSRAEIEAAFQEGLAYFKPDPVEEKRFSADLVPVQFDVVDPPAESKQAYQYGMKYALYSLHGESLQMRVVSGTIPHYRDMAPATWRLDDVSGKRLAGGRLPLDGKPHRIEVKVPTSGLYFFGFDDSTAGWQITIAAGRTAAITLDPSRHVEHAGWMQPMYFYVPRGTRELQYYWAGEPHRVHGPDGTVLQEVRCSGEFVKIPVPEGADGKTWHFTQLMLGRLWFFNAPNLLAASPDALLLPQELAEKDGLQIRSTASE